MCAASLWWWWMKANEGQHATLAGLNTTRSESSFPISSSCRTQLPFKMVWNNMRLKKKKSYSQIWQNAITKNEALPNEIWKPLPKIVYCIKCKEFPSTLIFLKKQNKNKSTCLLKLQSVNCNNSFPWKRANMKIDSCKEIFYRNEKLKNWNFGPSKLDIKPRILSEPKTTIQ